jgi:ABC-type multidrug transport system ATPase subunit
MVELPNSSRRWPTFRFTQKRDSGKEVLTLKGIRKSFAGKEVLHGVDLTLNRGDRLAILGPNGIGKSTLLKIAMGRLAADAGEAKWGYETHVGYFAQDHRADLAATGSMNAEEWLWKACPEKDRGWVRGRLGLMLFSGDDGAKQLESLSGGEAARLVFARIALENPNVLVLDEPTNHLDLESIEALVAGLQNYEGTLILVSHDRWFVGQLATRVVEISKTSIRDYLGTYEEYVHACGDDHLDADTVVLKAKREEKNGRKKESTGNGKRRKDSGSRGSGKLEVAGRSGLEKRRDDFAAEIELAEAAIADIDATFAQPGYFDDAPSAQLKALKAERARLNEKIELLMEEWEKVEREIEKL